MNVVFITHTGDTKGRKALEVLKKKGYQTRVVKSASDVRTNDVALFTRRGDSYLSGKGKWLRCSSIKFDETNAPKWALKTPHRVQVRRVPESDRDQNFTKALVSMAERYKRFNPKKAGSVPWARGVVVYKPSPISGIVNVERFKAFIALVLGQG